MLQATGGSLSPLVSKERNPPPHLVQTQRLKRPIQLSQNLNLHGICAVCCDIPLCCCSWSRRRRSCKTSTAAFISKPSWHQLSHQTRLRGPPLPNHQNLLQRTQQSQGIATLRCIPLSDCVHVLTATCDHFQRRREQHKLVLTGQ
jgi:hypothetical protein